MMDITLPSIPPRVGFRYKTRIGLTTLPMKLSKDHHHSEYKFTAQLSDGDYALWKDNGHFRLDDEVWKWDLIQELPIEWEDFKVDMTPYGPNLCFLDISVMVRSKRYGEITYCVTLPDDTQFQRTSEWTDPDKALNVVRKHFLRNTIPLDKELLWMDKKIDVMMDELIALRKYMRDLKK